MNKGFFNLNLIVSFGALLLVAVLSSGCPSSPSSNSAKVENAPVNKDSLPEKKAESQTDVGASRNREILWDFRNIDTGKNPEFTKAENDAVLKYLLGDSWDQELEITSRLAGAFTRRDAKETLYFVTGCKRDDGSFVGNSVCGHAGWNTGGWIAVFDGTKPVLKIEKALGGAIEKVSDVNGDGINEVLSIGGYTGMGIVIENAVLGQISGGKFEEIKTFRGYIDNCGDGLSNAKKAFAAIAGFAPATGGKMPEFTEEYFTTGCEGDRVSENPQWNKITKKEFDDFFDATS